MSQDENGIGDRLRDYFGLERNIVVLLAVLMIISAGEELWVKFAPKYLQALGGTAFLIGCYGTLRDLLDAVYQYPGGILADRLGRKCALLLFTALAVVGYVLYALAPNPFWFLFSTIFVLRGRVCRCPRRSRSSAIDCRRTAAPSASACNRSSNACPKSSRRPWGVGCYGNSGCGVAFAPGCWQPSFWVSWRCSCNAAFTTNPPTS